MRFATSSFVSRSLLVNPLPENALGLAKCAIAKVAEASSFKTAQLKVFAPSPDRPARSAVPLEATFGQWEPSDERKPYWVVEFDEGNGTPAVKWRRCNVILSALSLSLSSQFFLLHHWTFLRHFFPTAHLQLANRGCRMRWRILCERSHGLQGRKRCVDHHSGCFLLPQKEIGQCVCFFAFSPEPAVAIGGRKGEVGKRNHDGVVQVETAANVDKHASQSEEELKQQKASGGGGTRLALFVCFQRLPLLLLLRLCLCSNRTIFTILA